MPRRSTASALLVSFLAACAGSSAPPPVRRPAAAPVLKYGAPQPVAAFADPARRKKLEAAFPAIDAVIETTMKGQNIPGLSVAIVIDGQIAYAKGFGVVDLATRAPARADTVYRIGSITKSFTGLAILWLRDQGALGIDDPLVRWIPEAGGLVYPTRDASPLTLRQMLNHTSGLPAAGNIPRADATEKAIVESLVGMPLDRAPGIRAMYSNLAFSLLGLVVGRAAGSTYQDVVAQRIWRPLGMTSTYWESEDVPADRLAPSHDGKPRERLGAGTGAGGMYSTVEDLARYVAFQLDAYPARDDRDDGAIRRATRREAHSTGIHGQTHVALAPAAQPGDPMVHVATGTYGFGWAREENCYFDEMIGHGGVIDSYRAEVSFLPSRGVGVAVLSNFPNSNPQAVSRLVLEELRKTGALAARVEPLAPGFEPAVKSFLNVLNRYDDAALKEMLDPERPPLPVEKDELLGYHALHGTCTGYHVVEATGRTQARIGLTCERGTFEVMLQLHPVSKKVIGFVGTSRDVAAPPALAAAAEAIVGLGDRWDDAVYTKYLSKVSLPREDLQRGIAQVAAAHGSCKVKTVVHVGFDWGFDLACERGGGLRLTINTVPGDLSAVTGLGVQPLQEGLCPLR